MKNEAGFFFSQPGHKHSKQMGIDHPYDVLELSTQTAPRQNLDQNLQQYITISIPLAIFLHY